MYSTPYICQDHTTTGSCKMVRQHLFLLCAGLLWLGEVIDAGRASRSRRETPEPSWAGTPEPSWDGTPEPSRRDTPEPSWAGTPEPSWAGTPEPSWADTPETPSERRAVPDPKAAPAKRFNRPKTPSERRAVPAPKAAPAKRFNRPKTPSERRAVPDPKAAPAKRFNRPKTPSERRAVPDPKAAPAKRFNRPKTPSERRAVPDPKAAPAKRFNRPKTPSERRAVPDPKAAPAKRATGGKKVDEIKMFDSAGNQVTVSVEDACVEAHNRVRMLHENTPNVTYDAALANQAAEWALHLTTVGDLVHSSGDYGENLFYIGASPSLFGAGELTAACPAHAVYSWYSESWTASEQPYNYASETNPGVTGHFTQVVWKSSTKVGCGVAVVADGGYINTYVVARYTDRGNMGGSYLDNVMPMKAGAQRPSVSGDLDTVPGCAYYGANCGSAQSAGYCQYIKAYCECQCP